MNNILNITNITDEPLELIRQKTKDAILDYQEETGTTVDMKDQTMCHEYIDDLIEDFEENGKVKDALEFVDNLIVNFDYHACVKGLLDN